jgi:hypothetical protein
VLLPPGGVGDVGGGGRVGVAVVSGGVGGGVGGGGGPIVGSPYKQEKPNTFNDKQSQIAERKTGNGREPGNHSREAV